MRVSDNGPDEKKHFSRQWKMETCYGPKHGINYLSNSIFGDRCCLSPGQYTLTCINKKSKLGWGDAVLEIDGNKYCDDFVGFEANRTISVHGKTMC